MARAKRTKTRARRGKGEGSILVTLTLDTYSYVLPSMQKQAADVMSRWLRPPGDPPAT